MDRDNAVGFFSSFYGGTHHIPRTGIKEWGSGWYVNHYGSMSTFDFSEMTKLVILAHERCVRVEVAPSSPKYLKIIIHQRQREGSLFERHPTIEEAIKATQQPLSRGEQP